MGRALKGMKKIHLFLTSLIIAELFLLLLVTLSIRIDYWDGFAQLLNTKCIVDQDGHFFVFRPLLVSLLNVPVVWLKGFGLDGLIILKLSHLLSFLIGVGLVVVVYLFLRESFDPVISILSTFLFCLNRLFIHYLPFTMTDIPATLFYTPLPLSIPQTQKGKPLSMYLYLPGSIESHGSPCKI